MRWFVVERSVSWPVVERSVFENAITKLERTVALEFDPRFARVYSQGTDRS